MRRLEQRDRSFAALRSKTAADELAEQSLHRAVTGELERLRADLAAQVLEVGLYVHYIAFSNCG
jgi:hypothetical protein